MSFSIRFYRRNRVAHGGAEASAQSGEGSNQLFSDDLQTNAPDNIAFITWSAMQERAPNVHMCFWSRFPTHSQIATFFVDEIVDARLCEFGT